jgi:hypothetical protein
MSAQNPSALLKWPFRETEKFVAAPCGAKPLTLTLSQREREHGSMAEKSLETAGGKG